MSKFWSIIDSSLLNAVYIRELYIIAACHVASCMHAMVVISLAWLDPIFSRRGVIAFSINFQAGRLYCMKAITPQHENRVWLRETRWLCPTTRENLFWDAVLSYVLSSLLQNLAQAQLTTRLCLSRSSKTISLIYSYKRFKRKLLDPRGYSKQQLSASVYSCSQQ